MTGVNRMSEAHTLLAPQSRAIAASCILPASSADRSQSYHLCLLLLPVTAPWSQRDSS